MKRVSIFGMLLLTIIVLLGHKLYKSLLTAPEAEKTVAKVIPAPQPKPKEDVKPTARIVVEQFCDYSDKIWRKVTHTGAAWLRTREGYYVEGEMGQHGFVESIRLVDMLRSYAVVRCRDLDGTLVWIVATEQGRMQANDEKPDTKSVPLANKTH